MERGLPFGRRGEDNGPLLQVIIETKRKLGDVHPETGMVFWAYNKTCENGEYWITPEKFAEYRAKAAERERTPEARAKRLEYQSTPEYRAKRLEYQRTPEARAKKAEYQREHQSTPEYRAKKAKYDRERLKDPMLRLIHYARCATLRVFRMAGTKKSGHTFDLLGCTPDELFAHLEKQFKPGMTR